MSDIIKAIELLENTFTKYAEKDGDPKSLSKAELTELLHSELPHEGCVKHEEVCEFFKVLDHNGDGVVDFNEYIISIASLALLLNKE